MSVVDRMKGYKLNAGAFADLQDLGVPASITRALQPLEDRHFSSRRDFLRALQGLPAAEGLSAHQQSIIGSARVLRTRRVARFVQSYWRTFVPPSRFVPSLLRYFLLWPWVMTVRLRCRWYWFALASILSGRPVISQISNSNVEGFVHNRKQLLSFLEGHRNRTESLMNVLRTIRGVDFEKARLLCVGPRNEAEVLLLRLYGFRRGNIEAIDLFSYSPRIKLMDMNDLKYPNDHFDVYYSSAVIKYSPDIHRSIEESIRVTRDGGLMVFGFMFGMPTNLIPTGSELSGGVADLLRLYGAKVDTVFWQEEYRAAPDDIRAGLIFRLRKS
jgi:hypothetical protein